MKKVILTLLLGVTALTAFTQVPSYVPTIGLVGYWPFNGNANDESGNGNNGTVNGATLTIDRNGLANKAYGFDGSDWIEVMNSASIQPSTAFSISAWVFVESSQPSLGGNYTRIINKNHSEAQNFATYQLITGLNTGYGKAGVCIRTGSGISGGAAGIYTWTGATNNVIGQYQLIVGTYNGSELKIYQNGTLSSSVNHTGNLFYDSGNLWFGRGKSGSAPGTDMFFNGKIDDVGMWNRALTQTEITDLYNGCTSPSATITPQSSTTFCQGGSVVLNTPAATGNTYEWYLNGTIINDSIASSFTAIQSGNYTVKVTNGLCNTTSAATTVIVNPNPSVSFTALASYTDYQNAPIALIATPSGGTFSGPGVSGNIFTPSIAGLGTKIVTYNVSNSDNCWGSAFQSTIVYDTLGVVCTTYDTITVTDTLFITTTLGLSSPTSNTIKIYPNPANDHITIDNGNFATMPNYTIRIDNALGQQVFLSVINQQSFYVDLSSWSGDGVYFVYLKDAQGTIKEIRKIVLQ